jgi:hypothetical protein
MSSSGTFLVIAAALRSKLVQLRLSDIIYNNILYYIKYNLEVKTKKIDFYFYSKRLPQTNQPTNEPSPQKCKYSNLYATYAKSPISHGETTSFAINYRLYAGRV